MVAYINKWTVTSLEVTDNRVHFLFNIDFESPHLSLNGHLMLSDQ